MSEAAANAEIRDANERLEALRDQARADPEQQNYVRCRAVDRDWEGRLHVVSNHNGPAWDVKWSVATDVMDYFGLHGPFGNPDETEDLDAAISHVQSVIEARGGNFYWSRARPRRRHAVAMADEEDAVLRANNGRREP